jgi:hypothetical protein
MASGLYESVVLAKQPVGYWRLGEQLGPTAVDTSGFGFDGTYIGNPTLGQAGALVNDQDTAIGLNGPESRDHVQVPDPTRCPHFQWRKGRALYPLAR